MDLILQPWLKTAKVGFRYLDNTGISRGEFGGPPLTASRGGDRFGATLEFSPTVTSATESARERRILIATLARLQGRQNRIYFQNAARRQSGSFPASELITDNTFASGGLTNFTLGSEFSGGVRDRQARLTRNAVTATSRAISLTTSQLSAITAYTPYIFRAFVYAGRGAIAADMSLRAGSTNGGAEYGSADFSAGGLLSLPFVSLGTAISLSLRDDHSSGVLAGDYIDVPYLSFSRCALVDNGPNAGKQSNSIGTSPWTGTRSSVTADQAVGPDGLTTMDSLNETTDSGTHYRQQVVTKTGVAEDWTGRLYCKASNRTEARIQIGESGTNFAIFTIDLTDGSVVNAASAGGTVSNPRSKVVSKGNGIYEIFLTATIPASITTTNGILVMPSVAGSAGYAGTGTQSAIYVGGVSYAKSSLPMRHGETTTTADPDGTAQVGNGLHIKGLPVSTAGLLDANDEVEIITSYGSEYKILTAPLDSDAAGRGYLQFASPLRGEVSDNAAVIIHDPFGKFIFAGDMLGWDHSPGIFTTASADFEEAT